MENEVFMKDIFRDIFRSLKVNKLKCEITSRGFNTVNVRALICAATVITNRRSNFWEHKVIVPFVCFFM